MWASWYHNIGICSKWNALLSCTQLQSTGLAFGCALFWCWVSLCVPFTNSLTACYSIIIQLLLGCLCPRLFILFYTFWLSETSFATTQLPVCFCPRIFSLNIVLYMIPSDSFMSCLDSLLGCSTGEVQALQLIVLAVFGALDYVCWSTFWKSGLKWLWVCKFDIMENNFFIVLDYVCRYLFTIVLMSHNIKIPHLYLVYFHIANYDLFLFFFANYSGTLIRHWCSLHTFYCLKPPSPRLFV